MRKSNIFLTTSGMTVFVLLLEGGTWLMGFKSLWMPWVAFLMPVLWILWLCCFFEKVKHSLKVLISLWVLIDVAALCVLMAASVFGGMAHRNDNDYLFFIVYFPMIFPLFILIMIFPSMSNSIFGASDLAARIFFPIGANITLRDWLGFSLLSAISVSFMIVIVYLTKFLSSGWRVRNSS